MAGPVMKPVDYVFIHAVTSLVMVVVHDAHDERMLVEIADGVLNRVNGLIDPLCRVQKAYSTWRMAVGMGSAGARGTDREVLKESVRQFHRWRLGAAQAALLLQAS